MTAAIKRIFQGLLGVVGLVIPAFAEPTPGEISAALRSPAGVTWTVSGGTNAWRAEEGQLVVSSAAIDEELVLEATATGPGVLELNTGSSWGNFAGNILVDGAIRGEIDFRRANRVTLAAGTHQVRWSFKTTRLYSEEASGYFYQAKFQSYSEVPLQSAAAGPGVTLSGDWIGQNQWHAGDGAAAWSGSSAATNLLRADFSGPGILSYRSFTRRGNFSLKVDPATYGQGYYSTGSQWTRRATMVSANSRFAVWSAGTDSDVVIDEIKMTPEISLSEALDTPGWVWNAPMLSNGTRAFGYEAADAKGGSLVFFPSETSIRTTLENGGMLKIRHRGNQPWLRMGGQSIYASLYYDPVNQGTDWSMQAGVVPESGGVVTIEGSSESQIDSVEVVPWPKGLAETLGWVAGTVTAGGESEWKVTPSVETGKFVVSAEVTGEKKNAWLDFKVTGPCLVEMDYSASTPANALSFSLDGVEIWDTKLFLPGGRVTIAIPAGEHVVRGEVKFPVGFTYQTAFATISGARIIAGDSAAETSGALGYGGPWAFADQWEQTADLSRDGLGLKPRISPLAEPDSSLSHRLRTSVTGPGYVSVWLNLPGSSTYGTSFGFEGDMLPLENGPRTYGAEGWQQVRQWVPPGAQKIGFTLTGRGAVLANAAVDEMTFTPSEILSIGEALGMPGMVWQSDAESPWIGIAGNSDEKNFVASITPQGGGSTRLATTFHGPGQLKFTWSKKGRRSGSADFLVNGVVSRSLSYYSDSAEVVIDLPGQGDHRVEWVANLTERGSWLQIENMSWEPWAESSLAEALDTPAGVIWSTSPELPFRGRPNAESVNGTGAFIEMKSGEETWLEATVEGPGVFDFWLKDSPGSLSQWGYAVAWTLTVDGQWVPLGRNFWDPIWIKGAGTHRIRLTFRNESASTVSGIVDEVTWIPLRVRSLDSTWAADLRDAENSFPDGGRENSGGLILRNGFGPAWIEKRVTGPCVVEWDSRAVRMAYSSSWEERLEVTVDGMAAVRADPTHDWTKYRLNVPAGEHRIRWGNVTSVPLWAGPLPELAQSPFWQISDLKITEGTLPMAEVIEQPDQAWLLVGNDAGEFLMGDAAADGVDSYLTESWLFFLNLSDRNIRVNGSFLYEDAADWRTEYFLIPPRESFSMYGTYGFAEPVGRVGFDRVVLESLMETGVAEGIDHPEELESWGWRGLRSTSESHDGTDVAWSFLNGGYGNGSIVIETKVPSLIKYHWRQEGRGRFRLFLNGSALPVPPPTSDWAEVELKVGAGLNQLKWVHAASAETSYDKPGNAWLDSVSVTEIPAVSLDDLAADGLALGLSNSVPSDVGHEWRPVSYRDANGEWTSGARSVTGKSALSATVTGPVILNFRSRVLDEAAAPAVGGKSGPKLVVEMPGNGPITEYHLLVTVAGSWRTKIPLSADGWGNYSVAIPAGVHEVNWDLNATTSQGYGDTVSYPGIGAWVSGISLQSPRAHFDRWTLGKGLAANENGPEDDADGDGVSNLSEYAFGSDPRNAVSKPAAVYGVMGEVRTVSGLSGEVPAVTPAPNEDVVSGVLNLDFNSHFIPPVELVWTRDYRLMVPYLQPDAIGVIESTTDFQTWVEMPEKITYMQPGSSILTNWLYPYDTATHQAVTYPMTSQQPARFFRVRVKLSE